MQVPLLDLKSQYQPIQQEIQQAISEVIESQYFILGPKVSQLEESVAAYSQCKHGIGVSSGTDALLVALMALDIQEGDEVITTDFSFFATAGVIARVGALPVLVDIDKDDYNIDTDLIEDKITDKTKAIIVVHLYGQCAAMDDIARIAEAHRIPVIEDAAQAIGAELNGKRAGSFGSMGCFSFFPSKNLGAFGDGGMVVTNDDALAEKLRSLRNHGAKPKYHHKIIGGNFRLDAIQAAVLSVKLKYLDEWTKQRQENAAFYTKLFQEHGLQQQVKVPIVREGGRHIFNQYVIGVENRDALQKHLQGQQIGTEIYYPLPFHAQECFAHLPQEAMDFSRSAFAAQHVLALPIYPELTKAMQSKVVEQIELFFNN